MTTNIVYFGDNLEVLRRHLEPASIDLVYLDPPFNSDAAYVTKDARSAFDDRWRWDEAATRAFELACEETPGALEALEILLGRTPLLAYLVMMAPRLAGLRRALRPTGSIYLHCDAAACHYLKVLMDAVFGAGNFLNHVVWLYGLGGSSPRYWPRKHDDLLWYSREPGRHHFEASLVPARSQRMRGQMKKAPDWWEIPAINNMAAERLGYPTQKPEALLERIIESSSRRGDVVLDPFGGSGTTAAVAQRLGRAWITIDRSPEAIEVIRDRLGVVGDDGVRVIEVGPLAAP